MDTDNAPGGIQDRPMRKAVVLASDQNYVPIMLFLARQMHDLNPDRDFDICVVTDAETLDIPDRFAYLGLRIVPLASDPDHHAAYLRIQRKRLPLATYLRLWAPALLGADYDRLFYVDCDVFHEGGGLSRLFEVDMKGRALAAVRDVDQWYRPNRNPGEFQRAGLPPTRYFNCGVLLIDPQQFEADRIRQRCLELEVTDGLKLRLHDQSLINMTVKGEMTELAPVWNWQWPIKYPVMTDWVGPRLSHFIGPIKPWKDRAGIVPRRYQVAYQEFLARYFPDWPGAAPPGPWLLRSGKRSLWIVLRFLALRPLALRYFDLFPDPYVTR